jgi:hypothetical protein
VRRSKDASHGGCDGVVQQPLHVGYFDPAGIDQDAVRGAAERFQPDDRGHPGPGHVTVRGGDQQAFGG